MLTSILRILGRIVIILLVAIVVIGLASLLSKTTGSAQGFRSDEGQRVAPPGGSNLAEQPGRPQRGEGDGEGIQANGSLFRGLFQVFTNSLIIAVFVWIGLLLFKRIKRQPETILQNPVES